MKFRQLPRLLNNNSHSDFVLNKVIFKKKLNVNEFEQRQLQGEPTGAQRFLREKSLFTKVLSLNGGLA